MGASWAKEASGYSGVTGKNLKKNYYLTTYGKTFDKKITSCLAGHYCESIYARFIKVASVVKSLYTNVHRPLKLLAFLFAVVR